MIFILKGEFKNDKKAIISGVVCSSILLVGCNGTGENEEAVEVISTDNNKEILILKSFQN